MNLEIDPERGEDDLFRADGNDIKSNYDLHDVGERRIKDRMSAYGFDVVNWGIDMRDADDDELVFDDAMDFRVYDDGVLVALVEVKTKSDARYMGQFNRRHYKNYYKQAQDHDVPTFVVMYQITDGSIVDGFVTPIGEGDLFHETAPYEFRFPDANRGVVVQHEHRKSWSEFEERVL